jgi:hypothetical protein
MVGTSIHGLLGVDAELQRSVLAAQRTIQEDHSVRVIDRGDCPAYTTHKRDRV